MEIIVKNAKWHPKGLIEFMYNIYFWRFHLFQTSDLATVFAKSQRLRSAHVSHSHNSGKPQTGQPNQNYKPNMEYGEKKNMEICSLRVSIARMRT